MGVWVFGWKNGRKETTSKAMKQVGGKYVMLTELVWLRLLTSGELL
jgi:hypothetical protein